MPHSSTTPGSATYLSVKSTRQKMKKLNENLSLAKNKVKGESLYHALYKNIISKDDQGILVKTPVCPMEDVVLTLEPMYSDIIRESSDTCMGRYLIELLSIVNMTKSQQENFSQLVRLFNLTVIATKQCKDIYNNIIREGVKNANQVMQTLPDVNQDCIKNKI
jgi:hypothetical protein